MQHSPTADGGDDMPRRIRRNGLALEPKPSSAQDVGAQVRLESNNQVGIVRRPTAQWMQEARAHGKIIVQRVHANGHKRPVAWPEDDVIPT